MKKKEANLYSIPQSIKAVPHLKPEQIKEFESQFTLFDEEVEVRKIRDAINMVQKNEQEQLKHMEIFISELSLRRSKCTFDEYLGELTKYLQKQNLGDLIIDSLCGPEKKMNESLIRDILSQTLGYELKKKQANQILRRVFDCEEIWSKDGISMDKIADYLENSSQYISN